MSREGKLKFPRILYSLTMRARPSLSLALTNMTDKQSKKTEKNFSERSLHPRNWAKGLKKALSRPQSRATSPQPSSSQPDNPSQIRHEEPSTVQGLPPFSSGFAFSGARVVQDQHDTKSTRDSAAMGNPTQVRSTMVQVDSQHNILIQDSAVVALPSQPEGMDAYQPIRAVNSPFKSLQGAAGGSPVTQADTGTSAGRALSSAKDVAGATWSFTEMLLKRLPDVVDTNPIKIAAGLVKTVLQIKDEVKGNIGVVEKRIFSTMDQLEAVEKALAGWHPDTIAETQGMKVYQSVLQSEYKKLINMRDQSIFRKIAVYEDNKGEIADIFECINRAREQLVLVTGLRIHKTVLAIQDYIAKLLLERLEPSHVADHKFEMEGEQRQLLRRSVCTPGTRIRVLSDIVKWANDTSPQGQSVYWLSGQAGSGKSTIAFTIARRFEFACDADDTISLGGNFFCSRQIMEAKSATRIIRTIAYNLALKSKAFSDALHNVGKFNTVHQSVSAQLEGLLVEPWKLAQHVESLCFLIVIDALDEIEGSGGSQFLRDLLDTINKRHLPGLKFFVTSRPDPNLVTHLNSFEDKEFYRLEQVHSQEADGDIAIYLKANLPAFADHNSSEIQKLVKQSAGLFIYAATVVKYVEGYEPVEQKDCLAALPLTSDPSLEFLFEETPLLDALYRQIISEAFQQFKGKALKQRLQILHTFLCSAEPTSTSVVTELLFPSRTEDNPEFSYSKIADNVLACLHAVLYSENNTVFSYHKSFTDFIFNSNRAKEFFCDQAQHHNLLTHSCFQIMQSLKFNIANIETSYILNQDNLALQEAIKQNINFVLSYSCKNWDYHLLGIRSLDSDTLCNILQEFLQIRVMFWIEAMNLLGLHGQCAQMLQKACKWVPNEKLALKEELAEAASFALYFSGSQAAMSTPHLYISTLATWPQNVLPYSGWRKYFPRIPGFTNSQKTDKPLMTIETKSALHCVAFSNDNKLIVTGLLDHAVQIWDALTGALLKSLKGHTGPVSCVAFSSDNKHIVSGSSDHSVQIWDVSTGTLLKLLEGHTCQINSVAFSNDSRYIVSGSNDYSVWLWDISIGALFKTLEGHNGPVSSVAFSSDNKHIVSGSYDHSVRIWDVSTGALVKTLKGHTDQINSVAFSTDKKYIVSGSDNDLVQIWDAPTGTLLKVLEGHTKNVKSVAFSSDNRYIVSGSYDYSVRIWDALTGALLQTLDGHTGPVFFVAFSTDDRYVVSGSYDDSVQVWKTSTSPLLKVLEGHTRQVNSVAFSSDNKYIVSGSNDDSVCIWDASTGALLKKLEGHTHYVNSVAFSNNNRHIVSGSNDYSVQIWDASTGAQLQTLEGHIGPVFSVAFSSDDKYIVSGSFDALLQVWDASTGAVLQILEGHTGSVLSMAFSSDDRYIVSGSSDCSVRVWDAQTSALLKTLEGHTNQVNSVAFSSDDRHIVSGSDDYSVCIWDTSTGALLKTLKGHTDFVKSVAFSSDNRHIVSGSYDKSVDKSVRVWDLSEPLYICHKVDSKDPEPQHTGWLVCPTNMEHHLMFVPLSENLPDSSNILTIPQSMVASVDFTSAALGPDWMQCYSPLPQ